MAPPGLATNSWTSLHDHRDVHYRRNCTCGTESRKLHHQHDFLDLWHDANCGTVAVFCTLNHRHLLLHTTGMQQHRQRFNELQLWDRDWLLTDCTRGSCWTCTPKRGKPDQWTATGESQWSAAQDQGKRPLRHDSVIDDLDMHNSGHVNNQFKKAEFDTVRTCLCSITAISTTLSMN